MNSFLPTLISWLQEAGYPALWLIIFGAALGLPLPISLILLGAGAFASVGDFNVFLLAAIAISSSICGDICGYLLGRHLGARLLDALSQRTKAHILSAERIERSRQYFRKRGAWAIFLSRFLISALGSPINLLAGTERYPWRRFLLYDASGELLGAVIPLALGFAFGASWEAVGDILGMISLFALALLTTLYLFYLLFKQLRRSLEIQHIRAQRHTAMLIATVVSVQEESDSLL
ncbi:MAG: DedA family protein [Ktedonobacteraceae bacterium]|nr:DedA family protein [Ktedonobacteraceae bacterium]MBO0795253.1 DedA family protein [Ktedonobacteraceae bacterium]